MNAGHVAPRFWEPLIDIYLSGLLARRQNAWSQDGGNMRVIANGVNRCQYQDRPAGLLLWFVLVCRVMPRSLMCQDKLQLYMQGHKFHI